MSETSVILPAVLLKLSQCGSSVFRNNTGVGWVGSGAPIRIGTPTTLKLFPGDIVLRGPVRPLHAGLIKGSSDVIGWTPIEITQDMVGATMAIFTAVETKSEGKTATKEQKTFLRMVANSGGIAGIARSAEDAIQILRKYCGETK